MLKESPEMIAMACPWCDMDTNPPHGASEDPVGTYIEVGAHEAFTARSMVTEPTEERGGDQRYSLKGLSNIQHGLMLSSICVSCLQALMVP